jgi:glycosyltransferase involved in cell wall biosynthesis
MNCIMNVTKKKIAVIGLKGLPAFGGAAVVGENIINQINNQYEFTVLSISSHTDKKSGNCNNYYQKVFKKMPFSKLNILYYYTRSTFYVLIKRFDLIHLHHRDAAFILPILRLKYKVVLTTHGMVLTKKWKKYEYFFSLQDKFFLKFANLITTVSKKDLKIVSGLLPSYNKVIHIPNGITLNYTNFKPENRISFAAGRIIPDKGCHLFLEAMQGINYSSEIMVIGDYMQMAKYQKILMDLSAQLKNVHFAGLIKEKEKLFKIIGSSNFFVYPSLIESMSMVMLEVASLKVPIICSRIQENLDIFSEEEVLYFEPNDVSDLREKIQWAIQNPDEMSTYANAGYYKVMNNYQWNNIAPLYANAYQSLLK